jgi:hypothetical protein
MLYGSCGAHRDETRPHFRLLVIDHFTINDKGEFARAVYYFRPVTLAGAAKFAPQQKP